MAGFKMPSSEAAVIPMNGVEYLIGSENLSVAPRRVFDELSLDFIAELSSELLKSPLGRLMPDLAALAFWGRRASLEQMKRDFGDLTGRLGRGLCFHISPSNIPINFAFSWFFSLLAGNANIVRLPSRNFPQLEAFCSIAALVLKKYPELEESNALVRYPRDNKITATFCARADARLIWGGDETIRLIKAMPCPPRCVDICFADRYSLALLDAQAVLEADERQIQRLAENFYNDTYLMDQNACSSPQLIIWRNDRAAGRERFWAAVAKCAESKYQLQEAVAVDKYTSLCTEAIENANLASAQRRGNLIYRLELKELVPDIVNQRGHGGFFYEYALKEWSELFAVVTEKFQTATYFGLDAEALREAVIKARLRGLDRIVPVGKAMDIGIFWDGHDLVRELSRIISLG